MKFLSSRGALPVAAMAVIAVLAGAGCSGAPQPLPTDINNGSGGMGNNNASGTSYYDGTSSTGSPYNNPTSTMPSSTGQSGSNQNDPMDANSVLSELAGALGLSTNMIVNSPIDQKVSQQGKTYTVRVPGVQMATNQYNNDMQQKIDAFFQSRGYMNGPVSQTPDVGKQYLKDRVLCVVKPSQGGNATSTQPASSQTLIGCWDLQPQQIQ